MPLTFTVSTWLYWSLLCLSSTRQPWELLGKLKEGNSSFMAEAETQASNASRQRIVLVGTAAHTLMSVPVDIPAPAMVSHPDPAQHAASHWNIWKEATSCTAPSMRSSRAVWALTTACGRAPAQPKKITESLNLTITFSDSSSHVSAERCLYSTKELKILFVLFLLSMLI